MDFQKMRKIQMVDEPKFSSNIIEFKASEKVRLNNLDATIAEAENIRPEMSWWSIMVWTVVGTSFFILVLYVIIYIKLFQPQPANRSSSNYSDNIELREKRVIYT